MAAKKKLTLEKAIERLEEIAEIIERTETPLETSLELYKEGMALSIHCAERLENIKQEIKTLGAPPPTPPQGAFAP